MYLHYRGSHSRAKNQPKLVVSVKPWKSMLPGKFLRIVLLMPWSNTEHVYVIKKGKR